MYRKVSTDMNFVEREKEVLDFWKREGIMEKSFHHRDGAERFTFFDGPPTANGRPHIGHIETRAIKDLIPRYKTMKGYQVFRKAGWDTHGLPVELEVDLKKLARAAGDKKVEMIHMKELLPLTGYIRGGCSPVGMKKKYPTFLDGTCELCDRIAVSAGQRGVQMLLRPADLARYVEAKICDIAQ